MKLALIGYPIKHSLSPSLYQKILGDKLSHYNLIEVENPKEVPRLEDLLLKYDGINITAPYKRFYFDQVKIESKIVMEIGAINTIGFNQNGIYGTNTDILAVEEILANYQKSFPNVTLLILGDGVMAKVIVIVANKFKIPFKQFSRRAYGDISDLDLNQYQDSQWQTIVVNCCSRNFEFKGKLNPDFIFWDLNYSFPPHKLVLPDQVKIYQDGEEMLYLQAKAAVHFWQVINPKLKS
ncbi:MAG: hypothetical protein AB7I27_07345 [Bacteriovoracaceae bacterium]